MVAWIALGIALLALLIAVLGIAMDS